MKSKFCSNCIYGAPCPLFSDHKRWEFARCTWNEGRPVLSPDIGLNYCSTVLYLHPDKCNYTPINEEETAQPKEEPKSITNEQEKKAIRFLKIIGYGLFAMLIGYLIGS